MRAYFFGNMYLSSIQQGIQAAHTISDMFLEYTNKDSIEYYMLTEWALAHKTIILLNGGEAKDLYNTLQFFETTDNQFPFTSFRESAHALNSALTCVGIILPKRIYQPNLDNNRFNPGDMPNNRWEIEMMNFLENYRLAR